MPYIDEKERKAGLLLQGAETLTDGQLNYLISTIVRRYINGHGLRYTHLNTVIGVLECVKHELYRKVISPYEDIKEGENGCVQPKFYVEETD